MEAIIIWGVLWFVFAWAGWAVAVLGLGGVGAVLGGDDGATIGAFIGWLVGAAWWVFSVIQVAIHIGSLIAWFQTNA